LQKSPDYCPDSSNLLVGSQEALPFQGGEEVTLHTFESIFEKTDRATKTYQQTFESM
jgi:hypothetical protein